MSACSRTCFRRSQRTQRHADSGAVVGSAFTQLRRHKAGTCNHSRLFQGLPQILAGYAPGHLVVWTLAPRLYQPHHKLSPFLTHTRLQHVHGSLFPLLAICILVDAPSFKSRALWLAPCVLTKWRFSFSSVRLSLLGCIAPLHCLQFQYPAT